MNSQTQRAGEDTLRESEARYRMLVEHANDLVLEVEADGRIAYANPRLRPLLGLAPTSAVPTNLFDLVHEDDRARVRAELREAPALLSFRHRTSEGTDRWLEATAARFSRSSGEEQYVLVCRDGTERHETERALREAATLFTNTFRASPISNSITSLHTGRILEVNRAFESYFGYSRAEVIGSTTVELGLWADPTDRLAYVKELEAHGSVRAFEASLRNRAGQVGTYLMSAERVQIAGEPYLVNVIEDVTERRSGERALRESEEKFHKAFRTSPHPLSVADFETGALIEVNEAYERATGLTQQQLIGREPSELGIVAAPRRERALQLWSGGSQVRDLEIQFKHSSGDARTGLASADFIELAGRRCIIVGIHDITEQRRMEAAKTQLEAELRQVQKLEAIGTLAGGIAHDFNNILGAMLGYTEIAKLDAAALPEVIESLTEVQRAGERAKELVRQILTFSRRHPQERRPIRLQPILAEAHRLLRSTLPATIELSAQASPETERVHADPTQIHQIILNLATNAAHALSGKPGRIEIQLSNYDPSGARAARSTPNLPAGRYVELTVKDDGSGMDEDTLQHLFEPFFTTKKPGEGTGLGLSVVHGIVKDHEGILHVDSEQHVGSTFHIWFPVFSDQSPELEAAHQSPLTPGNGERILFIDDEPTLCSAAQKLLGKLNYVVTTRTKPAEAVQLFRADPTAFDLVITDLTMPGMTGVDVAVQMLLARPGMPLILVTGFNASWTLDSVRALGICDLVMKPLSAAVLSEKIGAALHDH